jgi:signal peptidase I
MITLWQNYKAWQARRKAARKEPETLVEHVVSWIKTMFSAIVFVMIVNGLFFGSFVVPTGSMEDTVATGDFVFVNRLIFAPSTPQMIPFLNIPIPYLRLPGLRSPEKGDVIVFIYPGDRDEAEPREFTYYLKRCIATAGDTLQIIRNKVLVNGVEFPLPEHGKFDMSKNPPPEFQNEWLMAQQAHSFPPGKNYTRDDWGPMRVPAQGDIIRLNAANYQQWETFIRREGHLVGMQDSTVMIDGKPSSSYTVQRDYVFGMGDNRYNSEDSRYWGFIPRESIIGTPMIVYWSWDTGKPITSLIGKLASIRWSRIGTIIR